MGSERRASRALKRHRVENVLQEIVTCHAIRLRFKIQYQAVPHRGNNNATQVINRHHIAARSKRRHFGSKRKRLACPR
jgi:hypothetical protein